MDVVLWVTIATVVVVVLIIAQILHWNSGKMCELLNEDPYGILAQINESK